MRLMSIKGSMSFACLKSCLNHAMLNYEKIIQMNSKRQTKFQFKKKKKLKILMKNEKSNTMVRYW